MHPHSIKIAVVAFAAVSLLAVQAPASAAKLHLLNCSGNEVSARTYNSYDKDGAVAATIKSMYDGDKATLECATEQCWLTLNEKNAGEHHSSHHYITAGPKLSEKVSEADWVCPSS